MRHLYRAGILVASLLVFIFFGLRAIPVPAVLVDFGFHPKNERENRELWASLPVQFASSSICVNCHQEQYTMW